jgi:DNA polymerase (family 10)
MERFVKADGVRSVTAHGDTKSSVVLDPGVAADLRVVADSEFPYALHHFTGSREHNVAMRQRAKGMGLKMNEYGLFRGDSNVPCSDEAAIFAELSLPFIPPELRENMGEIETGELPELVDAKDLVGVFHCHSNYSDGRASIEEMANAAKKRGYTYLALADHSQSAAYAGGLTPEDIRKQHAEIDRLNKKIKGFRVLKGIEADIRTDGSLDYDEETLSTFEVVVASVHQKFNMSEAEATKRLVKAVESPYTTILGHPTGRLLLRREGYPIDIDRILDACAANGVAVEINANPHRLDLDWRHIKRAKEKGVKLCVSPDAHGPEDLDYVRYGVMAARKGWLEKEHLLNCMKVEAFLKWRSSN